MDEKSRRARKDCARIDRVKVLLFAVSLLLSISLAAQKWFLAPQVAALVKDFGVETSAITHLIVFSPKTLAIRFVPWGITVAGLCLASRKVAVVVFSALAAANAISLGVIGIVYAGVLNRLS